MHAGGHSFNEVVLDADTYVRNLPYSLEAILGALGLTIVVRRRADATLSDAADKLEAHLQQNLLSRLTSNMARWERKAKEFEESLLERSEGLVEWSSRFERRLLKRIDALESALARGRLANDAFPWAPR